MLSLDILRYRETLINGVDFLNKSVLDIGCCDGYYSEYASRRGASQVCGIDVDIRDGSWKDKFDYVINKAKLKNVYRRTLSIYDIDDDNNNASFLGDTFDIVMFMGVLYHLRHPLLALEKIRKITKETLIIETHISCQDVSYPAMKFYKSNELNNDYSNWWSPNIICLQQMLRDVGFSKIELVGDIPTDNDGRITMICE